jgi:hypothetical protein
VGISSSGGAIRLAWLCGLLGALFLLTAACGGPTSDEQSSSGEDTAAEASEAADGCPSNAEVFQQMNAATYAIVMVFRTAPEPEDIGFHTFGTAFAVDDRLLATNGHITEGILGSYPLSSHRGGCSPVGYWRDVHVAPGVDPSRLYRKPLGVP